MKVYLDGNALCVVKDDFVNLQESEAFFVELTPEKIKEWKKFEKSER